MSAVKGASNCVRLKNLSDSSKNKRKQKRKLTSVSCQIRDGVGWGSVVLGTAEEMVN